MAIGPNYNLIGPLFPGQPVSGTTGTFSGDVSVGGNLAVTGNIVGTLVGVNTPVVAGQALTVKGTGNTGATNAIVVTNSTGGAVASLQNDGTLNLTKNISLGFGALGALAVAVGSNNYGLCFTGGLLTVADGGAAALQFDGSQNAIFAKSVVSLEPVTNNSAASFTIPVKSSQSIFSNSGAAGASVATLPAAVAGTRITLFSAGGGTFRGLCAGTDKIFFNGVGTYTTITSTQTWSAQVLICWVAGNWGLETSQTNWTLA